MGAFAAILAIIKSLLGIGEKIVEEKHDQAERQGGAAQQKAADQDKTLEVTKEGRNVENTVDGLSDADVDKLSDEWTRKPGQH